MVPLTTSHDGWYNLLPRIHRAPCYREAIQAAKDNSQLNTLVLILVYMPSLRVGDSTSLSTRNGEVPMSDKVDEYLSTLLTNIQGYELSLDETRQAARSKSDFITRKILRKKYRRRADGNRRAKIAAKVVQCICEDRAIGFTIPFGGYKHFWNPSYPQPDWAELFHFRQMTEYLLPILAVHAPGVVLEYVSEDLIVPRMDNYPDEALDAYASSFHQIVDWYDHFTPNNLEMRFWRLGDYYDKQAIIDRIEQALPARLEAFHKLPADQQAHELRRSVRSVFWNGKQDLSSLNAEQRHVRIIEARLMEKAFSDIAFGPDFAGTYYDDDNRICTCFSFGMSSDNDIRCFLTLQSSPGSIVDHWIGRGVLQEHGQRLRGTIVSRLQYRQLLNRIHATPVKRPSVPLANCRSIEIVSSPKSS